MAVKRKRLLDARDLTDADIYQAMREISGYLDITPADFKEVYLAAYRHALERLRGSVKAADVMKREVQAVRLETPLAEVARLMAAQRVSGLPVLDHGDRVAGVLSEKDFLASLGKGKGATLMAVIADWLDSGHCAASAIRTRKAAEIMSSPPVTVTPEVPVLEVCRLMIEKKINRVPVVSAEGKLLGIIARSDLIDTIPF